MLTATQLACSRGERRLFGDLSFSVEPGGWLHVTGENGAGKTTLLRTLVGLSPADSGEIRWDGIPVRDHRDEFHRLLIYLGHQAALKDELSPLENLQLALALEGQPIKESDALAALDTMGLRGREDLPARYLSAGQKRRVLLARLLLRRAPLWVLDEPFNALDKAAVELLGVLLEAHLERGGMVVLTSHQPVPMSNGEVVTL
ncbi:MAG TPA: cytochrome c biogenesis heme-transporting ATPase CcmA [Albitalea sp.]|nr:cytochrome c biogenesis heme-transporting ATPase CcmA [Albitalea sp.]